MKKAEKDTRNIVTHTVTIEFKSCGADRLTNKELRRIVCAGGESRNYYRGKVPPLDEPGCSDFAVITSVHSKRD